MVVVPIRSGSDGDATHRPTSHVCTLVDPPTLYLEKLGALWMKSRGSDQPNVRYALDRLPTGYALYERPRLQNHEHIDKYLFGHPSHRCFNSPNHFFPHFLYLMENGGNSIGCDCKVCNPNTSSSTSSKVPSIQSSRPPTPRTNSVPKAVGRKPKTGIDPGLDTRAIDEEGTPDVYRNLINKLKHDGTVDEAISEPMSMDWRAEQELLPKLLEKLEKDEQWIPRVGDVVLYIRELASKVDILRHPSTGDYRLYDKISKIWVGFPSWEAGLIGQATAEATTLADIVEPGDKVMNVSYSGVRVEPLPNPNGEDKSFSKRYSYVPVLQTRPLMLWRELLHNIPQDDWHVTIINALTLTSSFSLMGKHHFRGTWPNAHVFCHGIFIGSEMIAVGDTVRLLPSAKHEQNTCSDVMVIKSIRLRFSNLDLASTNDYDDGRPYNSEVFIYGAAYTTDGYRSSKEWHSADDDLSPKAGTEYGPWYPLHPMNKQMAVPFTRVVGRLYERDAMTLWLNTPIGKLPDLSPGREGVTQARAFAQKRDRRIIDSMNDWFWGESRAEALDLETINGLEVGKWDADRDPKKWRRKIKHMEDMQPTVSEGQASTAGEKIDIRKFMAPGAGSSTTTLPVRNQNTRGGRGVTRRGRGSGRVAASSSRDVSSSRATTKKTRDVIEISSESEDDHDDEEDEDDDDDEGDEDRIEVVPAHKKPRVMIVIDR